MTLSVIIVSYNVRHFLHQCLLSVFASAEHLPGGVNELEVFVVDNASRDRSVEYIRSHFPPRRYPSLHIIANARNVGFGRANNQAVRRARGQYILFLNPDTLLTENTLSESIAFSRTHPEMGALGVYMQHSDGRFAFESRRGLPTPWASLCKMSGLASLFPRSRVFGQYYMRYLDVEKANPVDIISGAYMLVQADTLRRVGSFDEAFFMYGEDIDLSFRLLRSGCTNYYLPTPILHYKGESTHKSSYRYVHVFYGAMLIFFRKHYPHYRLWFSLPIKAAILAKALFALLKGWTKDFLHYLRPTHERCTPRLLYVGRHTIDIRRIAERYGLDIDIREDDEQSLPDASLPDFPRGRYLHVVYDLANFSRNYVLRAFRHSDHRCHIGTYTPESGLLITGSDTFSLHIRHS